MGAMPELVLDCSWGAFVGEIYWGSMCAEDVEVRRRGMRGGFDVVELAQATRFTYKIIKFVW